MTIILAKSHRGHTKLENKESTHCIYCSLQREHASFTVKHAHAEQLHMKVAVCVIHFAHIINSTSRAHGV